MFFLRRPHARAPRGEETPKVGFSCRLCSKTTAVTDRATGEQRDTQLFVGRSRRQRSSSRTPRGAKRAKRRPVDHIPHPIAIYRLSRFARGPTPSRSRKAEE